MITARFVDIIEYFSNLKWLLLSFRQLLAGVENWQAVASHYLAPIHQESLLIRFRTNETLRVPRNYILESIVETLLLDVYRFEKSAPKDVVVDVGASIGDFSLLASRDPSVRVYAFEPSGTIFNYLRTNMSDNGRRTSRLFNIEAGRQTLNLIFTKHEELRIDFLKIDCEGCEYELLGCSNAVLAKVREISMEVHSTRKHKPGEISSRLREAGFHVEESRRFGQGHYLHATNLSLV